MERRYFLQLVVESKIFYRILQHLTTPSESFDTSKILGAQFIVNSRSQILQDSIRNYQLLRYLIARQLGLETLFAVACCRIYNILWVITTFHNFVEICHNFKNSSGVVSCTFPQLDATRFHEELLTSTISNGTEISGSRGVICCSLLKNLQHSMGYYNILQLLRSPSKLGKYQRRSLLSILVARCYKIRRGITNFYDI